MKGGKRPGAGRPEAEPAHVITFLIPDSLREIFRIKVKKILKQLKNENS